MSSVIVITEDPAITVAQDEADVTMVMPVTQAVYDYTTLGNRPTLGSAAALDAGVVPGNVVQLDIAGKLPVIDGSQLTGVPRTVDCGRLSFVSSTSISFAPLRGILIRIAGVLYTIPSGGVSITNASLTPSTRYYVYAFINGGNLTLELSTTGRSTSTTAGNVGVEIKTGDETRSLVGMIWTTAAGTFADSPAQRFVRSWFNDDGVESYGAAFTSRGNTASTAPTMVELQSGNRIEVVLWAGERWLLHASGATMNGVASAACYTAVGVDGTTPEPGRALINSAGSNAFSFYVQALKTSLAEGYHYATILGAVSTGTGQWYADSDSSGCIIGGESRRD